MLQVFFGTDQIKVRQQAHLAIEEILTSDKEFVRLDPDTYEAGQLLNLSNSASLFSSSGVYLVDSPSLNESFKEDFISNLEALATSLNVFILIEREMLAAEKKSLAKYTDVIQEYKKDTEQSFSPFKMADALALRDKRTLWLLLQEAKQNGLTAEEIIGTLWWQLKTMRLAAVTKNAEEAGIKDYPYKKAKSALNTFMLADVESKTRTLLRLYHEGHRGKRDINLSLEEWVLTL